MVTLPLCDGRGGGRRRMEVIGLLLQSLQRISIKLDHDAGGGGGRASCFGVRMENMSGTFARFSDAAPCPLSAQTETVAGG